MADYACIHCQDQGDCRRCSWFYTPGKIHSECGEQWSKHEVRHDPKGFYASYTVCPKPVHAGPGQDHA